MPRMPESPRTDPSAESALKDPWAEFLRDPIFRPTLLYSTKAFTLWQRSDGPLLQLDLVPDGALTGRTLEVGTGSGTKRGLPLKLTIQADPPWQSPRANGLGLLDFNEAGE